MRNGNIFLCSSNRNRKGCGHAKRIENERALQVAFRKQKYMP